MELHLCCPLHSPNGSVRSALALCQSLQAKYEVVEWPLLLDSLFSHDKVGAWFGQADIEVRDESPFKMQGSGWK